MLVTFASVPIGLLNSAKLIAAGDPPLQKVPRNFFFEVSGVTTRPAVKGMASYSGRA